MNSSTCDSSVPAPSGIGAEVPSEGSASLLAPSLEPSASFSGTGQPRSCRKVRRRCGQGSTLFSAGGADLGADAADPLHHRPDVVERNVVRHGEHRGGERPASSRALQPDRTRPAGGRLSERS
uniref:Uncharacterized protein n=1 Tax=Emiliania huxleyi TaxID=2903 RepID=A0A6V2TXA1_EMIHU